MQKADYLNHEQTRQKRFSTVSKNADEDRFELAQKRTVGVRN
jgi:uncharacterized protein YegJ (DUF2314 family)